MAIRNTQLAELLKNEKTEPVDTKEYVEIFEETSK